MNKQQFIKLVNRLEEQLKNQENIIDQLNVMFGSVDGELSDTLYEANQVAIDALKYAVNDENDWLEWYLFESNSSAIDESGLKFEITSIEKLIDFVGWKFE